MESMTTQKELPFGKAQLESALSRLTRYKNGKTALETRIKEENLWWRRRHTEAYKANGTRIPAGAQLFTSIENKIADICDNIPDCSFLARSRDDEETAKLLTKVMPAILEQCNMESAFIAQTREKVTLGTGVYAVTWDASKQNGLGDVSVRAVSPLNLYWEPGVSDIEDSPALFFTDLVPNEVLCTRYPALSGKLDGGDSATVSEFIYDDTVDNTRRTAVIDYYYKKNNGTRTLLHYAKICAGTLLYSSENDEAYRERGFYDHAKYPFVFDALFPLPGSPCGFGYVSVGKEQQYQIDRLNNAIVRNAIIASTRRKYIRRDANINAKELMDIDCEVVTVGGSRDVRESVMTIDEPTLSGIYVQVLESLSQTLKETTANRDFAQGSTTGGVTSGTAINALVESGSKQSRMILHGSYEAYKKAVTLVFELYRQFCDTARLYRIDGEGEAEYAAFSNESIKAKPTYVGGVDIGTKEPVFDILVRAHKKAPFARLTQNSMMQELYGMGFFSPEKANEALLCLEGMEFDGKEALCRRISEGKTIEGENAELKQAMLRLCAIVDAEKGTALTEEMSKEIGANA